MTKQTQDLPKPSPFFAAVKLLLLIILIALVPLVSREVEVDPENVRLIGRCAAGLGVFVLLYALIKQVAKVVIFLALAALVFAVLVSEGMIDLPRLAS